jgi:hypothetical protein
MKYLLGVLIVVLSVPGVVFLAHASKDEKGAKKVDNRIFELRTYTTAPGKMEALNARFRNHTNRLFEKHGMTIIGFWMPAKQKEGEEKLIYILAYPSKEAADKSWKGFREDPEWQKVRAESEKDASCSPNRRSRCT